MSSCLIITQGNKMYIGADTACSIITEDGYRRFSDDMPKLFSLGNSVFFCSGRKIDAEKCVNWIYDNFKTEIDIKELEHYFKDVSTVVSKDNLFNIEFLLCDYDNHKVVQLSQYNDFKPMIYDYSDELRILCGGYKTKDSFLMAKKNLILNKSTREIYKDVFESISDECVGGKVILYNSPTSFEIISLKESDIKYANNDNELFLLTSDFVTSGVVNGSQIIGGDIFSENYSPTTGTHIALNDGSFNFGHKIIYDALTNKMTMSGVTIEWNSTTNPSIDNVNGLNEKLSDIDNSITSLDETFANKLTNYVTNTVFNGSVAELQSQIDGSITTWFEDNVPSLSTYPTNEWITVNDKNKHLGDLYYDNLTGYAYRFQLSGSVYEWIKITDTDVTKALADAKYAQDTADGKRRVFVTTPTPPYDVGDLWVQGTSGDIMRCAVAKTDSETYVVSDWIKASKYTDDTKADEAYTLADSAKGVADNAKTIGEALVNGLGFKETEITGEYIISPVIAGGTLLIGDKSGTYAQITETGILNCVGANIRGTVYATDGEFTGKITASDGSITGNLQIGGSLYSEKDNYRVTLRGVQSAPEYGVFFIEDLNGDGNGNRLFPFRLNGDGSFAATKANIEGKITAIDGEIGGINISSTGLYYSGETSTDGFGLWRNGCHPHNNSYIIMHAGANGSNIASAKFKLYQDGSLYTSNLNVTGGSITGGSINIGSGNFEVKTSGEVVVKSGTITLGDATLSSTGLTVGKTGGTSTIGSFKIDSNSIFRGSWNKNTDTTPEVFVCSGSDYSYTIGGIKTSGWVFGAGKNFGVTNTGAMYCSAGQIGNWTIASNGALIGKAQTDTSPYTLELYPSGIDIKGNTFYILICKDNGNTPVAGMTTSGWVSSI